MSEDESNYRYYYRKGKALFKDNKYKASLTALRNAFEIKPSEDLQIKINKIESLLEDAVNNAPGFKVDENKLLINEKYYVNESYYNKLYNYQKEGVTWLFKNFENKKGCILADDMGLGKTVQIIFYLRELFESDLIKSALIIMPKSLLVNWEREVTSWAPSISLLTYLGNDREKNLRKIQKRGGILLSTYGTIMNSWEALTNQSDFKWGVLALDEGHKIKNPSSKTFKAINTIKASVRIVMTGTAVQNNLKELWALLEFTHQGSLLGSYPTFNREYEKPITDSRKKDASQTEKLYGDQISLSLKNLIKPYFLRRTKEEVLKVKSNNDSIPKLRQKNDIVVWISMTEMQIEFYKKFLEFDKTKILLLKSEKRSPLLELNMLKKICDHPRLMKSEHQAVLGLEGETDSIDDIDINVLMSESGKMSILIKLIKTMIEEQQKCLVFSQSKVILNIIQKILSSLRIRYLRLDGDILKAIERQEIVDKFNEDSRFQILLLTSQVGGVGLTLTGASRVIIYDLNWNPSVDAQAVDRVYRIGQKQNVIIYRLITCGTVEEKIYRRQIFKESLNRQTTGIKDVDNNSYRYFTQNELFELFTLGDPYQSKTQIQLDQMHSHQRISDAYLDDHIKWLSEQNGIFGISHHDLMFTKRDADIYVDEETKERLIGNILQAEETLAKDAAASAKPSIDELQLRALLGKMSIMESKSKIKEKYSADSMFIPSKADIRRPIFNKPANRNVQTVLDNFVSINKTSSTFGTHIDLTANFDGNINENHGFIARDNHASTANQIQENVFENQKNIVVISDSDNEISTNSDVSADINNGLDSNQYNSDNGVNTNDSMVDKSINDLDGLNKQDQHENLKTGTIDSDSTTDNEATTDDDATTDNNSSADTDATTDDDEDLIETKHSTKQLQNIDDKFQTDSDEDDFLRKPSKHFKFHKFSKLIDDDDEESEEELNRLDDKDSVDNQEENEIDNNENGNTSVIGSQQHLIGLNDKLSNIDVSNEINNHHHDNHNNEKHNRSENDEDLYDSDEILDETTSFDDD